MNRSGTRRLPREGQRWYLRGKEICGPGARVVVDHREVVRSDRDILVDERNEHGVDDLRLIVEDEALGNNGVTGVVGDVHERCVCEE